MRSANVFRLRLRSLFSRRQVEQELEEELQYHLERQIDQNIAVGMNREDARYVALRSIVGMGQRKEECRDMRGLNLIDHLLQDLRFAIRQLRKNRGFAATAIFVLALGMCASIAIFAFVDAALIKPLPYPNPDRLVSVNESAALFPRSNLSYLDYLDWKRLNTVFRSLDVYTGNGYILRTATTTALVQGASVSAGFFRTLGVSPVLGRDFHNGEDSLVAPNTVILSYATWRQRFGGRKDVIGRAATLSGTPYTIIGVLPQQFQFAPRGHAEFWTALHGSSPCEVRRSCHNLDGIARLKDGVSVQAALADMKLIAKQLERQYPASNREQGANVLLLSEAIVGNVRPILLVLLSGAALLLFIVCVNVASLLLVRSETRKREIALRGALGASAGRLILQFTTEGRGRYFTDAEDGSKPQVVIINQALARKYFPREDAIGKKIGDTDLSPKSIKEIIGIVDDIKEGALDSEIWPAEYLPFNQSPDTHFSLVARTSQAEQSLLPTVEAVVHRIDPNMGTINEATMTERINDSQTTYLHRSSACLVGGFATLALLLSVVGLYGVVAYSVSQRTREIGVRMALGAQRSTVYQLVLKEAGWLTAVGIVIGLVCSVAAATLIRSLLFGVRSWDAPTLATVVAALAFSALLASYIPAPRAASVDPIEALRTE